MAEDVPAISLRQIDAILRFLPVFEGQDYVFGQWQTPEGQFPYFSYSREVMDFVRELYDQGFIVPFDWASWKGEAERYRSDPDALAAADLLTLRKLLTAHVRADRFSEGHLASVLESGHITVILRRLRQICERIGESV